LTRQQHADLCLARYQAIRELPDDERIEVLMSQFFDPPTEPDCLYDLTMRRIQTEMEDRNVNL
jgi:hypothetical protein